MRHASLLLLLLVSGLKAGERGDRDRRVFFREADRATRAEIRKLISTAGRSIGNPDRKERIKARRRLAAIGPWSVPFLMQALTANTQGVRVRMNSAIVLARIRDVRSRSALRAAARRDRSPEVRLTCCLALGRFGDPADVDALREIALARKQARPAAAALLALARIGSSAARTFLASTYADLPRRATPRAVALVLAGGLAGDAVDPAKYLDHPDPQVASAAAAVACVSPLPAQKRPRLIALLRRRGSDATLRALRVYALAAIPDRDADLRGLLLELATRGSESKPVREAALLGLADERGLRDLAKPLVAALRKVKRRNDRLAAPLLFALARTGTPEALAELTRIARRPQAGLKRYYAAGSLLFVSVHLSPEREAETVAALEAIRGLSPRGLDAGMAALKRLANDLRWRSDRDLRRDLARKRFAKLSDPLGLHLWDRGREERAWALVNNRLVDIFGLDQIADTGNPLDKVAGASLGGGDGLGQAARGGGGRAPAGKPEEQDLYDFLRVEPYLGPEVLHAP